MKTYGEGGITPPLLILALDINLWSPSGPCLFTAEEGRPGTHWMGHWVTPRAGLNTVVKVKVKAVPVIN
jgi:hypothetical protein